MQATKSFGVLVGLIWIALLEIFSTFESTAQSGWTWQIPLPQETIYNDVQNIHSTLAGNIGRVTL